MNQMRISFRNTEVKKSNKVNGTEHQFLKRGMLWEKKPYEVVLHQFS